MSAEALTQYSWLTVLQSYSLHNSAKPEKRATLPSSSEPKAQQSPTSQQALLRSPTCSRAWAALMYMLRQAAEESFTRRAARATNSTDAHSSINASGKRTVSACTEHQVSNASLVLQGLWTAHQHSSKQTEQLPCSMCEPGKPH